ncbi:MAG: aspartate/glutamate racemase family protein [Acidobacteriota bacterium]
MDPDGPASKPPVVPGLVAKADRGMVVVFDPRTPDRTAALLGRAPSPLPYLQASIETLARLGASCFGVPCNTAHAFLSQAFAAGWQAPLPMVDLIQEAARAAVATGARAVGVLATSGTIQTGLYQTALRTLGARPVVPIAHEPLRAKQGGSLADSPGLPVPEDAFERIVSRQVRDLGEQEGLIMEAIYGEAGIKAGHTTGLASQLVERALQLLVRREGVEAVILGCTELPLVVRTTSLRIDGREIPIIDSTDALARALADRGGVAGIAGGLGPEATIDLIRKMDGPVDLISLAEAVFHASIDLLWARRDQDHVFMLGGAGPDPAGLADRLADAGATVLVAAASAVQALMGGMSVPRLPVVVGDDDSVGALIVRAAGFGRAPAPAPPEGSRGTARDHPDA